MDGAAATAAEKEPAALQSATLPVGGRTGRSSQTAASLGRGHANQPRALHASRPEAQLVAESQHVLQQPDAYIGSTAKQLAQVWVHNGQGMEYKSLSYSPGLLNMYDGILVAAAQQHVTDPSLDTISVEINAASNTVRVMHNGAIIPVELLEFEDYVPELVFGRLVPNPAQDHPDQQEVISNPHAQSLQLCNIFSKRFVVDLWDGTLQRRISQNFSCNMQKRSPPMFRALPGSQPQRATTITFEPDLALFDMTELEEDTVALMEKRLYDVAGVLGDGCKVSLNGKQVPVTSFPEYCELYLGPKENGMPRVYGRINNNWEVCITASDSGFKQVSLVNGYSTTGGGTHVDWVTDQVAKHLMEVLGQEGKAAGITPALIKDHLWVFVNGWLAANATFTSQARDTLTTPQSQFSSGMQLPKQLLEEVAQSGIMNIVLSCARRQDKRKAAKGSGSSRSQHGTGSDIAQLLPDQDAVPATPLRRSSRHAAQTPAASAAGGSAGVCNTAEGRMASPDDVSQDSMERPQASGLHTGRHLHHTAGGTGGASSSSSGSALRAQAPAFGAPPASPWHGRTRSTTSKAAAPPEVSGTKTKLQGCTSETEHTSEAASTATSEASSPQQLEGAGSVPAPLPAPAATVSVAPAAAAAPAAAGGDQGPDWGGLEGKVLCRIFHLASTPGRPGVCLASCVCRAWQTAVDEFADIHLMYDAGQAARDNSLAAWLQRYPHVLGGVTLKGSTDADVITVLEALLQAAETAAAAGAPLELHTLRLLGPGRRPLFVHVSWARDLLLCLPNLRTLQLSLVVSGSEVTAERDAAAVVQKYLAPLQQATQLEDLHVGLADDNHRDDSQFNPALAALLPANLQRLAWQWYGSDNSEACSLTHLEQLTFLQAMANDRQPTQVPLLAAAAELRSLRHLHLKVSHPPTLTGLSVFTGLSRLTLYDKAHYLPGAAAAPLYAAWGQTVGYMPAVKWLTVTAGMFRAGQEWLTYMPQLRVLVVDATFTGGDLQWLRDCNWQALPCGLQVMGWVGTGYEADVRSLQALLSNRSSCESCVPVGGAHLEEVNDRILQVARLPAQLRALV